MTLHKAIKSGGSLVGGVWLLLLLSAPPPASAVIAFLPNDTAQAPTDTTATDSTASAMLPDSLISSTAPKTPVNYQAKDSVVFNLSQQEATLYNKAQLDYQKMKLKAGKVILNWSTNLVQARGLTDSAALKQKPVFTESGKEYRTDSMDYNFSSEKGKLYNLRTEQGEGYLHGDEVKKNEYDVAYASEAKYTTCDKPEPHFYLSANKIKTIPGDKIVSGPANIVVGGVPLPIVLPFGFFPNTSKRSSGLIFPSYGEANQRGFFLKDIGYYTGISDKVDLKLLGSIYSKGSWSGRIESNYKNRYQYRGNIALSFGRNVYGEPGDEDFRDEQAYSLQWRHNQAQSAHPYRTFSADVDISSLDNRRNRLEGPSNRLRNQLSSRINYAHSLPRTPFSQLNLSVEQSQNLSQRTFDLTLPSGNLSTKRIQPFQKADLGILKNLGVDYDLKFRNELSTTDTAIFEAETWNQFRNGARHSASLNTSFNLLTYLSVSPGFQYNERFYFRKINRQYNYAEDTLEDQVSRGLYSARDYSFSANLSTNIYGSFNVNQLGISAIRHAITPTVNFNYQPDFGDRRFNNFDTYFDRTGQRQRYFRYQGPFGQVPTGARGNMNINVQNNLEMKVRKETDTGRTLKKVSLIDQFSVSTNYNFLADSFPLSDLRLAAQTKVLDDAIAIRLNGTLDPYYLNPADSTVEEDFALARSGSLGRVTNFRLNVKSSLNPKTFNSDQQPENRVGLQPYGAPNYVDFDVPWNINIKYNLQYQNRNMNDEITRNFMSVGGDLSLTENLKIGSNLSYSLKRSRFEPTRVRVSRDLHCWQMSFQWAPFSERSFYMFRISAKSSVLKDLEYEQRNQRF